MSLDVYREKILRRFTPKAVVGHANAPPHAVGDFDSKDMTELFADVRQWWTLFKAWERDDTLTEAYKQQRLTVKGTSTMNLPIEAHKVNAKGLATTQTAKFSKPVLQRETQVDISDKFLVPTTYNIVKTNQSIKDRLDPAVFVPKNGGESRKTELGLHDLSAGLMNPKEKISLQQYKTPDEKQVYVFMPLSHAGDQAVFQNINRLAKLRREENKEFYDFVREVRSKMTRVKLAAEHDMATNFILVGHTANGRPKLRYSLIQKTDVSTRDQEAGLVPKHLKFEKQDADSKKMVPAKVVQAPTTLGILEARRSAAINFQTLLLGTMLSYGEVTVAYRQHDGGFPKFAKFADGVWTVGTIEAKNTFVPSLTGETLADRPV